MDAKCDFILNHYMLYLLSCKNTSEMCVKKGLKFAERGHSAEYE